MKTWLFIVALLLLAYGIFEPSIRKDTSNKRWLVFFNPFTNILFSMYDSIRKNANLSFCKSYMGFLSYSKSSADKFIIK